MLHALILKARSMEDTINGIIRSSLATPGPYGGPSWEPEMGEAEHALMCQCSHVGGLVVVLAPAQTKLPCLATTKAP